MADSLYAPIASSASHQISFQISELHSSHLIGWMEFENRSTVPSIRPEGTVHKRHFGGGFRPVRGLRGRVFTQTQGVSKTPVRRIRDVRDMILCRDEVAVRDRVRKLCLQ